MLSRFHDILPASMLVLFSLYVYKNIPFPCLSHLHMVFSVFPFLWIKLHFLFVHLSSHLHKILSSWWYLQLFLSHTFLVIILLHTSVWVNLHSIPYLHFPYLAYCIYTYFSILLFICVSCLLSNFIYLLLCTLFSACSTIYFHFVLLHGLLSVPIHCFLSFRFHF